MKTLQSCLFCENNPIYQISNDFDNSPHTVKSDMLEFFGSQIEEYLRADDALCNRCMNLMESVTKLKRRLLPLIFRFSEVEDRKPITLGKKWDIFASISFDDDFLDTRSPTPNNFVFCKRTEPYNSVKEKAFEVRESYRTASRNSRTRSGRISRARSEGGEEIDKVFSGRSMSEARSEPGETRSTSTRKRGRKRGHSWTRRKNGRYSRPMFTYSREEHYQPEPSYNVEVNRVYVEQELHECTVEGCTYISEDIDLVAKHKVNKHKEIMQFECDCGNTYTSSWDLVVHKKIHKDYTCKACRQVCYSEGELLQHWQEHVKNAVVCSVCDAQFLNDRVLNSHRRNVHKRNIPIRVDYQNNEKFEEPETDRNINFEARILIQDAMSII